MIIRILLMFAILAGFILMIRKTSFIMDRVPESHVNSSLTDQLYWPKSKETVVHHSTFALVYDEKNEQARWVAYILTREELNRNSVDRTDWFEKDESILTGSADFYDYKGSGYSKGHLLPSADRAWNREVNEETFLMSNISPQLYHFNGGIWRELEENVRDWARENNQVYIVTGPVIGNSRKTIGDDQVAVPEAYFKVVLDLEKPEQKSIGFLIPNEKTDRPLSDFARAVDEIEKQTGIDFYDQLFESNSLEDDLESTYKIDLWPVDEKRYHTRVQKWNN